MILGTLDIVSLWGLLVFIDGNHLVHDCIHSFKAATESYGFGMVQVVVIVHEELNTKVNLMGKVEGGKTVTSRMNSKLSNNWTLDKNNYQVQIVVWSSWIGKQVTWWAWAESLVFTMALLMASLSM